MSQPDSTDKQNAMPKHIAIIMDGNGRWATKRFLPRLAGHAMGVKTVHQIVEACLDRGIKYLTLFAFSSENWRRPMDEVSFLMRLFKVALRGEIKKMNANNVRLRVIGDLSKFEPKIQEMIKVSEEKTAHNTGLILTVCANYGGHWDMLQAASKIINTNPPATPITEEMLSQNLSMAYAPDPALMIRTGGESRMSNFLLWQMANTELYFTDIFWPDFGVKALDEALEWYHKRDRQLNMAIDK